MSELDTVSASAAVPAARPPWRLRAQRWVRCYANAICWGLLTGTWLYLSIATWATWPNIDVDCGRDVYIPARIAGLLPGGPITLYRDVQYQFGPLLPYGYALLFRLFGLHLDVIYLTGILVVWGIVACTYAIAARLAGRPIALLTALTVLIVFAFRNGNFNYVFPYTLNANYGLLFLALLLWALIRILDHPHIQYRDFLWIGGCAAISLLLKQEYGLAAMILLAYALWDLPRRRLEIKARKIRVCLLAPLALPAVIYGYFLAVTGWRRLVDENLFAFYIVRNARIFYGRLETIHLWRAWFLWQWRLRQWFFPSLLWVLALTALWAGMEKYKKGKFSPWLVALFLVYPAWRLDTHWELVSWRFLDFYFWPLTAFILVMLLALRFRRLWNTRETILFLLSLSGLALLSRAWGDPITKGYNNPLLWPSMILLCYVFMAWLPEFMFRWSPPAKRYAQIGISLLFIASLSLYLRSDLRAAGRRFFEVSSRIGLIRSDPSHGLIFQDILQKLKTLPGNNLLVIPGDQFLYLDVNKVSPLPYTHLIVSYIGDAPHELAALRMLRRDPPGIIALMERNQAEYFHDPSQTPRYFGHAYARRFRAWIHRHYRLVYKVRYVYHWGKIYIPQKPDFARSYHRQAAQPWQ